MPRVVKSAYFYSVLQVCRHLFFCSCLLLFGSGVALAQNLPGSVDPARLQDQLEKSHPAPSTQSLDILPNAPQAVPSLPPPVTEGFVLKEVVIEGATVFSQAELTKTYKDYIGQKAELGTIQFIAGRITQLYRDRGFFLSRAVVPQQEVEAGRVRIVVVEGYGATNISLARR